MLERKPNLLSLNVDPINDFLKHFSHLIFKYHFWYILKFEATQKIFIIILILVLISSHYSWVTPISELLRINTFAFEKHKDVAKPIRKIVFVIISIKIEGEVHKYRLTIEVIGIFFFQKEKYNFELK